VESSQEAGPSQKRIHNAANYATMHAAKAAKGLGYKVQFECK